MTIREIISRLGELIQGYLAWAAEVAEVAAWQVNWLDAPVSSVIAAIVLYVLLYVGFRDFFRDIKNQLAEPAERKSLLRVFGAWFVVIVLVFSAWLGSM